MSRDELERLRDIKDAITGLRDARVSTRDPLGRYRRTS